VGMAVEGGCRAGPRKTGGNLSLRARRFSESAELLCNVAGFMSEELKNYDEAERFYRKALNSLRVMPIPSATLQSYCGKCARTTKRLSGFFARR